MNNKKKTKQAEKMQAFSQLNRLMVDTSATDSIFKSSKLRNCPFCGSKNLTYGVTEKGFFEETPKAFFWVQCKKCKVTGPEHQFLEKAIKRWNGDFGKKK